jgi:asparagine synthase (glutamine-hydrolysing)
VLAFAWRWDHPPLDQPSRLSDRLAASLCAGIGGYAGAAQIGEANFAYRPLRSSAALSRTWRPALLPNGRIAIFHGYFDNSTAIANELGVRAESPDQLYALAVERWGDEADRRIIGEYCALIVDRQASGVRLSRSPLRAPPLYYFDDEQLAAAASVPRALFAAGAEQRLNEGRVADSALLNFTDREESWFEGIRRVPRGCIVELQRGQPRRLRQYYDLLECPDVRMASDADYIARAGELLDEGVRACMAGFRKAGATLSGGLDTPQVVLRALAALPPDQHLPTFTFHPEAGYDGRVEKAMIGDERPFVEAFAAMHPRLEPHFTANEGYEHDYRWNDFFHLMGAAPSGLANMYVFHGLFSEAAKEGCDVLLLAEWGNYTFSDRGDWGFVEYLLKGKWRQLWRALGGIRHDDRSIGMRFLVRSLSAFLPLPLWRFAKRFGQLKGHRPVDLVQPLSPEYRRQSGADQRLKSSGLALDRYQPRNHRDALRLVFQNDDSESGEVYQAFEQMYGIAQRDPTAYRPFVEFCLGLPTEMFLRDGTSRWLAKEMAKGVMPDEQRGNLLNGRWDADWHLRIGRRRKDFLGEIDRLAGDERIARMLDLPRLRAALEDWPEQTETDPRRMYAAEMAVPRGLLTARFVRWAEGRNTL